MTLPMDCQELWMAKIGKGESVSVQMLFGNDGVAIDLRRINNIHGHLQFRYERKGHHRLRKYLQELCDNSEQHKACVIEVIQVGFLVFRINPISGLPDYRPRLSVYQPVCHLIDHSELEHSQEFRQLTEAISSISFIPDYSQKEYNSCISTALCDSHWIAERSVHDDIGLRCDFYKAGVWTEVEFGNARGYYQDYVKFLVAAKYRDYAFGILLCPTASFADYLCELGKQRADTKGARLAKATYSGMMTYEKAVRELPCLIHIIREKIVVAGLDVQSIHKRTLT